MTTPYREGPASTAPRALAPNVEMTLLLEAGDLTPLRQAIVAAVLAVCGGLATCVPTPFTFTLGSFAILALAHAAIPLEQHWRFRRRLASLRAAGFDVAAIEQVVTPPRSLHEEDLGVEDVRRERS